MKFLFYITLTLISSSILYAQETKNKAAPFIRVYDRDGKKISKGRIASATDTSLITGPREKPVNIGVSKIGFIKTKRSAGNNILWGAGIGASTGLIAGVIEGETEGYFGAPVEENIVTGALVMMPVGAVIGAITVLFKKSKTFSIDGDTIKWKAFREAMGE